MGFSLTYARWRARCAGKAKKGRAARKPPAPRPRPRPIGDIDLPAGQRVIVDFPPVILSPNDRSHWSKKTKAAAEYHRACKVLTMAAKMKAPAEGLIMLRLDFFPPNRVRRDDDNAIAAFKHGRDGIAAALGIDDARFRILPVWHEEPRSCVVATILEGQADA